MRLDLKLNRKTPASLLRNNSSKKNKRKSQNDTFNQPNVFLRPEDLVTSPTDNKIRKSIVLPLTDAPKQNWASFTPKVNRLAFQRPSYASDNYSKDMSFLDTSVGQVSNADLKTAIKNLKELHFKAILCFLISIFVIDFILLTMLNACSFALIFFRVLLLFIAQRVSLNSGLYQADRREALLGILRSSIAVSVMMITQLMLFRGNQKMLIKLVLGDKNEEAKGILIEIMKEIETIWFLLNWILGDGSMSFYHLSCKPSLTSFLKIASKDIFRCLQSLGFALSSASLLSAIQFGDRVYEMFNIEFLILLLSISILAVSIPKLYLHSLSFFLNYKIKDFFPAILNLERTAGLMLDLGSEPVVDDFLVFQVEAELFNYLNTNIQPIQLSTLDLRGSEPQSLLIWRIILSSQVLIFRRLKEQTTIKSPHHRPSRQSSVLHQILYFREVWLEDVSERCVAVRSGVRLMNVLNSIQFLVELMTISFESRTVVLAMEEYRELINSLEQSRLALVEFIIIIQSQKQSLSINLENHRLLLWNLEMLMEHLSSLSLCPAPSLT